MSKVAIPTSSDPSNSTGLTVDVQRTRLENAMWGFVSARIAVELGRSELQGPRGSRPIDFRVHSNESPGPRVGKELYSIP